MSQPTRSGKNNPCPVCGRTKDTDCRIYEAGNHVLCHTYQDEHPDGTAKGYKFHRTSDKAAGYGVWLFDTNSSRKLPKPARSSGRQEFIYHDRAGQPLVKVIRSDDGNGKKKFSQIYRHPTGTWEIYKKQGNAYVSDMSDSVKAELKSQIPIYRYAEVREAIAEGKPIIWAEGETCCDALWNLGIPSTTSIGGSKGYRSYGSYQEDLAGATVILCPDRDEEGMSYMGEVSNDFPNAEWLFVYPRSSVYPVPWQRLPKNGGLDIADWIADGATSDEIEGAIVSADTADTRRQPKPKGRVPELSSEELKAKLEDLLQQDVSQVELKAILPELAKRSDRTTTDVWHLYQARQKEIEDAENRDDRAAEIQQLLQIGNYELSLENYLDSRLAIPLESVASVLGSSGAAMLTTLLPVAGSLLKVGTQLELIRATEFYALPILYTGIVAESGSSKSPTQKAILKPLFRLQGEAEDDHRQDLKDWTSDVAIAAKNNEEPPEKPNVREYYTTDATREAIVLIQSQQPDRGFLGWFDELSGLIGSQNQYRSGKGTDKEAILSGRDGTGIKTNRASGKRFFTQSSAYSITGSTQPDTLRKLIGDFSDPTGQWARFLWTVLPIKPARFPENDVSYDASDLLHSVYLRLESFEAKTYRMSDGARAMYADWYNELDDRRLTEPRQGMRAVYAKMKADTGTLALLLHCINAAISADTPADTVSAEIMRAAIHLSKYYLGQVKLIHAEGGTEDTPELEQVYTKLIQLSERRGWLKAKDAQGLHRFFRKLTADNVRSHFRELQAMGLGSVRNTGRQMEWKASAYASAEFPDFNEQPVSQYHNLADKPSSADPSRRLADKLVDAQSLANSGFSHGLTKADTFSQNGKNGHESTNGRTVVEPKTSATSTLSAEPSANPQNPHQASDIETQDVSAEVSARQLKVGDRVNYAGSDVGLGNLCRAKILTIQQVEGHDAVIKAEGWAAVQRCPLTDLRRV